MALKSAGTERAFSLLNILLGSNQDTTLFDYMVENGTYLAKKKRNEKWRF